MTPLRSSHRRPRRGAILLVVITLLALFAVIGLSFVLYAESAATGARIHREAANVAFPMPNPDDAANGFLRQLIYPNDPTVNPSDYLLSGLTGHELARLMYGHNLAEANDIPYNGLGLFHEQLGVPLINGPAALTIDRAEVVNHTLYRYDPLDPNTWLVVDPEYTRGLPFNSTNSSSNKTVRLGSAEVLNGGLLTAPAGAGNPNPFTYVGKNAPYTYPDRNNLAVALVNPTTGQVIVPSFHRPTLFGGLDAPSPTSATANPNWFLPAGRFKTVRPRRIDQLTAAEIGTTSPPTGLRGAGLWPIPANPSGGQISQLMSLLSDSPNPGTTVTVNGVQTSRVGAFPYPPMNPDGTITGDVQNLRFADGRQRNDSFWMDLNLPTFRGSSGSWKQYPKGIAPLVAAIVIPLDGRVNLSVAGNLRGTTGGMSPTRTHVSNQGFGPHEINPAKVLANLYNGTALPNSDIDPVLVGQQLANNRYDGTKNNNAQVPAWPGAPTLTSKLFQPDPAAPANPANEVKPPAYAQVDWAGTAGTTLPMGVAKAFNLPGQDPTNPNSGLQSQPTYYGYYNDAANNPAQSANQPLLFNPYTRSAFGLAGGNGPGVYPSADIRRMDGRYSDRSAALSLTYLVNASRYPVPFGSQTPPSLAASGASATGPGMPSNVTRALTTPYSSHLNRPGLAPNYLTTGTFQYNPTPGQPYPVLTAAPQFNLAAVPQTTTPGTDLNISPPNRTPVRNVRAGLSAVDLNRPLADYRTNRTQPLSATNVVARTSPAVPTQPEIDRQQLARDVFRRLVVACGANVTFDDTPGPGYGYPLAVPAVGTPEHNAVRWLAQLAANAVDYVDSDDVSTPFVWNPVRPPMGAVPANFEFDPANLTPAELKNRVVYGVEKPRLVLNEVYAELANDVADRAANRASKPFKVRFFVELLNPATPEANPNPQAVLAGPDNKGAVALKAGTASAYRVQVFDKPSSQSGMPATSPLDELQKDVTNVLGRVASAAPKLECNLGAGLALADPGATASAEYIEANGGTPAAAAGTRAGFGVVGPPLGTNGGGNLAFDPPHAAADVFGMMLVKTGSGTDALEYDVPAASSESAIKDLVDSTKPNSLNHDLNRHLVVLRRLANPYLPANDPNDPGYDANQPANPYLTVDYVSQVEVNDAVKVFQSAGPNGNRNSPPQTQDNYAVGRVQPYAGFQNLIAAPLTAPTYKYDTTSATDQLSLVLKQVSDTGTGATQNTSLFRHNARATTPASPAAPDTANGMNGETLLAPFQWLVHLDRPLVSPAELLHLAAVMPHELTRQFAKPVQGAANGQVAQLHRHDLQRPAVTSGGMMPMLLDPAGPLYAGNSPLYRGLELLAVKPWTHAVPAGGRTPGKVNVNMIWDEYTPTAPGSQPSSRVLEALLDPQAGNGFTQTDVQAIWAAIKKARSPSYDTARPVEKWVGPTREEVVGATPPAGYSGLDRPFRAFGGSLFDGGPVAPPGAHLGGVNGTPITGVQDTLLRQTDPLTPGSPPGPPVFQNTAAAHPYQQWEPLRKVLNNLTTVTDTYLVIYTVGYFEVREETTDATGLTRRVLGAEAYNQVPGDLRAQYTGVIDRSMLGTTAGQGGVSARGGQTTDEWFTELAMPPTRRDRRTNTTDLVRYLQFYATGGDNTQIQLQYEGRSYTVVPGTQLRLGAGGSLGTLSAPPLTAVGNAEVVTVANLGATGVYDEGGNGPTNLPAFDPATGLATVTLQPMSGLPANSGNPVFPHRAGEPVSGLFSPANPGAQAGFDRTAPQYQGVIPYHGRLYPGQ
ncbi:MAG: hypothetical protein U0871_00210 [Gemmataceae bacterium]